MIFREKLYRNVKLRAFLLEANLTKAGIHQLSALLPVLIRNRRQYFQLQIGITAKYTQDCGSLHSLLSSGIRHGNRLYILNNVAGTA